MGARENQGLQIALIIFVMITVVLAVTTYIYWKKTDEQFVELNTKNTEKAAAEDRERKAIADMLELKQWIGHAAETQLPEVKTKYEADMGLFATSYQGPKNYTALPPFLLDEIAKRNRQIADLESQNTKLAEDIKKARDEERAQTKIVVDDRDKLKGELTAEQGKFVTERSRITDDNTKIAAEKEKLNAQVAAVEDKAKKEKDVLQKALADATQLADALKATKMANQPKAEAEVADGRITFVSQRNKIVWINLGSADGLRRQLTFSVVDRNASNVGAARKKGSIEVTVIKDAHVAEARIIEDDLNDPILADDQIFTPAWHPGQRIRFALAGFMDIDGDGKSDRAVVRNLVAVNGGVLDAEVHDDGQRTGKLDINTRYLVLGNRPTDKTNEEAVKAYTALTTEADRLGIEKMPVDKFVLMMGYRNTDRTIELGRGASASDFKAKPADGVLRSSDGNNAFKERRPPAGGKGGAFDK